MIDRGTSAIKTLRNKAFTRDFRFILYNRNLTWGEKALLFAILDLPPTQEIVWAKLARKLHCHPPQVHKWRRWIKDLIISVNNKK